MSFFLVQQNHFFLTMTRKEWTDVVKDALGFKSIYEEKTTFDIPLIYFVIYLWYSSIFSGCKTWTGDENKTKWRLPDISLSKTLWKYLLSMRNNPFWSPEKVLQHHFMSLTGDSSLAEIIQYYLDKGRILSEEGESSQFYFQFGSEIITIINHSQLSLKSPLQHITVGKATSSAAINRFYISPQTHRHHTGAQTVLLAEKDNW